MQKNPPIAGPHLEFVDFLLRKSVLRLIPNSISPNTVTSVRFLLTPVVLFLLYIHSDAWAAGVFSVAALSDALDGAMARTRGQITQWGKIADPLADKLLIGTTALYLVTAYVGLMTALVLVGMELLLVARSSYNHLHHKNAGANAMGKIKMVLQSVALLLFFANLLWPANVLLTLATWVLYTSLVASVLSLSIAPSV